MAARHLDPLGMVNSCLSDVANRGTGVAPAWIAVA
jgi:hypothetical protein